MSLVSPLLLLAFGLTLGACPKPRLEDAPRRVALRKRVQARRAPPARAKTLTAGQIVDKAIAAAGGLTKLKAAYSKLTMKTKGTYGGMPFTANSYFKEPGSHAMYIEPIKMGWGHSDSSCWQSMRGIVLACGKIQKRAMRQMHAVRRFVALYPLKGAGVKLGKVSIRSKASLKYLAISVTPLGSTHMGVKEIKTYKVMWALQHGHFDNTVKWLKALKKKLKAAGKKVLGLGAWQAFTPLYKKGLILSAVMFPIK